MCGHHHTCGSCTTAWGFSNKTKSTMHACREPIYKGCLQDITLGLTNFWFYAQLLWKKAFAPAGPTAFLHHLSNLQPIIHHAEHPTILLGDFNIDLRTNKTDALNLSTLLRGRGFEQLVKTPTTPQGSLLDHVWSTTPGSVDLNPTYWSDHMATIAVISLGTT
jgi:hypothetical protein